MTGFVYKWTNTINRKWYIGSHKGTLDDGYRHTSKILALAEEKYGLENFEREILYEGNDYRNIEAHMLIEVDAANDVLSYNRCNIVGSHPLSKESQQKKSESHKRWWKELKNDPIRYKTHIEKLKKAQNNRAYEEPLKGKTYEEIYGVEKAQKLKKRRSAKQKKNSVVRGKTYEELYGLEKALQMKKKKSEFMKKYNPNASGMSKEHCAKLSLAKTGQTWTQQKLTCLHCKKEGGIGGMKRYHFDNCKENIT